MKIKENNILLIGNGFDLAHELKTSYNDFLFLMKHWDEFYRIYGEKKKNADFANEFPKMEPFLKNISKMEDAHIEKLGKIIQTNVWANYYRNCEAEIDGWIDFEREMYPVLDLMECICDKRNDLGGNMIRYTESPHGRLCNIAEMLPKYINGINIRERWCLVTDDYFSDNYGVLKKKIMKSLKEELEEFILALEIYFYEFVEKTEGIKIVSQIKDIHADYLISFNYTTTERIYEIREDHVHHLHGAIRKDSASKNNMVLGVNEREHQDNEFIYFVKYFQRIQKHCGTRYKEFTKKTELNSYGIDITQPYNLYIYGHSLDATDKDVLEYLIGHLDESGEMHMKANRLVIFYYDQTDFEKKVINLINMYGRAVVEEKMELGEFIFEFINNS